MGFETPAMETPENQEYKPVILTKEEFDFLRFPGNRTTLEWQKLMDEKGIKFNSGNITISVDGEEKVITTETHDFGTVLDSETIERKNNN